MKHCRYFFSRIVTMFVLSVVSGLFTDMALAYDHSLWTQILKEYLNETHLFDYHRLINNKKQQADLYQYTSRLNEVQEKDFRMWSETEKKAFLINAYNSFTIRLVIDYMKKNPDMKSIKDAKEGFFSFGPWKDEKDFIRLFQGKIRTLDAIEHDTLRKQYPDYRIHAAVNCASFSCPVLRREAYEGAILDKQLDEQMRIWLHDESRNQFDPGRNLAKLSKVFDWFAEDFAAYPGGLHAILKKHGPKSARQLLQKGSFETDYLDYNWDLNQP